MVQVSSLLTSAAARPFLPLFFTGHSFAGQNLYDDDYDGLVAVGSDDEGDVSRTLSSTRSEC